MKRIVTASVLLLGLMHAYCTFAEDRPIKIGVMLCLTGDCSEWGENGRRGIELAVSEINAAGGLLGRKLQMVIQDSRDTSPQAAVSAFHNLALDPEINFIVGPTWTVGGMPVAPLISRNQKIVVISPPVGVKEFNETSDLIFNTWQHDKVATRALAHYAAKQSWKKGAIFGSQDPWCQTQSKVFKEEFERLGGKIEILIEPLPQAYGLATEALKVKSVKPDFVLLTNYSIDVISKEFSKIGFAVPLIAVQVDPHHVKAAAGALDGTVFAMYEKPAEGFRQRFKQKFNAEPGISADTGYDAVMVWAQAVREAKTTLAASIKKTLTQIRNFNGASGTFSFDSLGAVDKQPVLWRIKGLEYERVGVK